MKTTNDEAEKAGRGKNNMNIQAAIRNAFVETGRISSKDRIEIIEKSVGASDYARIGIYAYHGRKKTPYVYWNICINMARGLILWDMSTFYYM